METFLFERFDKLLRSNVTGNKTNIQALKNLVLGKHIVKRKRLFSYCNSCRETQCVCIKCGKRLISWDERTKCLHKNPTVRNRLLNSNSGRIRETATGLSRLCQLLCNYIGNSRGEVICSIPNAAKLRLVIRHSRCNHTYLGNLSVVIAKVHNLKICKAETSARLSGNKTLMFIVSIKRARSNRRDNNCC